MTNLRDRFLIALPHRPGAGGPGSFQFRFEEMARDYNWTVVYRGSKAKPDAILVVGGTKHLLWLILMKVEGVRVVYRLDGINWIHRKRRTTFKQYFLNEVRNWMNKFVHAFLSDIIIYQSEFSRNWWEREGWRKKRHYVIYNGIDIDQFRPSPAEKSKLRLVCLEGNIDYSPYAVKLINVLRSKLPKQVPIELYGNFELSDSLGRLSEDVAYLGPIRRDEVPMAFKNSIYLSLDVNPACPNTVIEALACGAPVVGFDTGSLRELISEDAGIIVPYGANPWDLEFPDAEALVAAIFRVMDAYSSYSEGARRLALTRFRMEDVFQRYVNAITSI